MIRSAAKNHDDVAVIVEASDYAALTEQLAANDGATMLAFRKQLAAKAYGRTAAYDAAISGWFSDQLKDNGRQAIAPSAASCGNRCATAKIRTSTRRSMSPASSASASPPLSKCKAKS